MLSSSCICNVIFSRICHMDAIDRKIIAKLQKNGRASATEVAEIVGLSLSSCHRRIRALEDAGVINGYQAKIDPAAVGLNFSAIVFVTLKEGNSQSVQAFDEALPDIPEIIQAQRLFGDPDYVLHIVTRDLSSFQVLYDRRLSALPSVLRLTSTLVMKTIFQDRALPL